MKRCFLVALVLLFSYGAPSYARNAAVTSAHPLATAAGEQILRQGGNAFDAAVAVAATLGVVEPYASGLGGGGFFLLHRAADGFETMVDAREAAPLEATAGMYLDDDNKLIANASREGARAAAIPGTPAALAWLARKYGRLPLHLTLAPAIGYARDGFSTSARYASIVRLREPLLRAHARAGELFLADGELPPHGHRLRQPALAKSLEALARRGHAGFYAGPVANELVRSVRAAGGIWQLGDLKNYRIVEREPVRISYRGLKVTTAALPSAAGATLAQSLNILEAVASAGGGKADRAHYVIEALRRAFQDRARYLGDPDFVSVPLGELMSERYAAARASSIEQERATPSAALDEIPALALEGADTSHFSIVDADGNRVAATLSINTLFGSGVVAGTTGILLNNEMDDFVVSPGASNTYRLTGGEANAIAPGKRPLSSMSPTFLEDARGVLIFGSSGGSRIMSQMLLAILDYADQRTLDVVGILNAPRYHHQYLPDRVDVEKNGFSAQWIAVLEAKGHRVNRVNRKWGNMQAVLIDKNNGTATAAGDPRTAAGWPGWF